MEIVRLFDPIEQGVDAFLWAEQNCSSFITYELTDVSDLSYQYDIIADYLFVDKHDAIYFTLVWKN